MNLHQMTYVVSSRTRAIVKRSRLRVGLLNNLWTAVALPRISKQADNRIKASMGRRTVRQALVLGALLPFLLPTAGIANQTINVTYNTSYTFFNTLKTWPQAEADCAARGSHLATICDANQVSQARDAAKMAGGAQADFWTGLSDRGSEGSFVWSSGGSPTSQNSGRCGYRNWVKTGPCRRRAHGCPAIPQKQATDNPYDCVLAWGWSMGGEISLCNFQQ